MYQQQQQQQQQQPPRQPREHRQQQEHPSSSFSHSSPLPPAPLSPTTHAPRHQNPYQPTQPYQPPSSQPGPPSQQYHHQPSQPAPQSYQPRTAYQPQQQQQQQRHQQQQQQPAYQPSRQQPPQPRNVSHSQPLQNTPLPDPPKFSSHDIEIPRRGSSSNLGDFVPPASPSAYQQSHIHAPRPTVPSGPAFNHPLAVQEYTLEPPQRSFATFERPSSADRPNSVASFSNLSTHSNEPLNPPTSESPAPVPRNPRTKQSSNRIQQRPGKSVSAKVLNNSRSNKQQNMQTARSITPQPWHPDYQRDSTVNPLDLPEERLNDIDSDDRHDKNGDSKVHKTRKSIFTRLRRSKTKVEYKVSGTGRLAQFSNERLYLHWIRFGILQGTIAVTLLSYGNEVTSYVGVGAMVLTCMTLVYATTLYHLRHIHMVTKRKDVVYFAKTAPTMICLALFLLYGANFVATMSIGEAARSQAPWTQKDDGNFKGAF